jgi:hypothetical protein
VEYLSDQPNKEYAFLQQKCLDPIQEQYMPARQSIAFKKSMKGAEAELLAVNEVLEVCLLCFALLCSTSPGRFIHVVSSDIP